MRNLALSFVALAAVVTLTAATRPPVEQLVEGGLPKCGSDGHICMGSNSSSAGQVEIGGNLLVDRPILVGPNSPSSVLLVDGGVGVNGALNVNGTSTVVTSKATVVDAGVLCVQANTCVTRILPFTTAAIDFANATIVCEDSPGTTVTGAKVGDPCFVGMPETLTAGGTGLHHNFTCYVSAANTIKVRACAAGTADNPGSVVFQGVVVSQTY